MEFYKPELILVNTAAPDKPAKFEILSVTYTDLYTMVAAPELTVYHPIENNKIKIDIVIKDKEGASAELKNFACLNPVIHRLSLDHSFEIVSDGNMGFDIGGEIEVELKVVPIGGGEPEYQSKGKVKKISTSGRLRPGG